MPKNSPLQKKRTDSPSLSVISEGENLKFVLSTVTTFSDCIIEFSVPKKDASTVHRGTKEISTTIIT